MENKLQNDESPSLSVIILNVKELNSPIKIQILAEWIKI